MLQDGGILLVLLPMTVLEISKDHNMRLGAVGGQVFVTFYGDDAHGGNGIGDAFGKATEATIFLERYFHVDIVLDEAILLLKVGVVSDRAVYSKNHKH